MRISRGIFLAAGPTLLEDAGRLLNQAFGGYAIGSTTIAGTNSLGKLPNAADRAALINYNNVLDNFNMGVINPGHCGDDTKVPPFSPIIPSGPTTCGDYVSKYTVYLPSGTLCPPVGAAGTTGGGLTTLRCWDVYGVTYYLDPTRYPTCFSTTPF